MFGNGIFGLRNILFGNGIFELRNILFEDRIFGLRNILFKNIKMENAGSQIKESRALFKADKITNIRDRV